jgi:hypothetical protein
LALIIAAPVSAIMIVGALVLVQAKRRVSASGRRQPLASMALARGDGDLPLPKPVRNAILTSKWRESGECRTGCLPPAFHKNQI